MIDFYNKYKADIYSQNGEDGIIDECLKRMAIKTGSCCEYGAHDGAYCSNTRALIDAGWKATLIEGDAIHTAALTKLKASVHIGVVTPDKVNTLVPQNLDVLSIDTDGGNDYYCWQAYTGNPAIVIVEVNSSIPPSEWHVSDEKGASYRAMVELGLKKGYFLLCHTGNCVFVRNEHRKLFPEIEGDGLKNADKYFRRDWL